MKNLLAIIIIFIMLECFEKEGEGVVAADINRMSWLVDSGLSSFVTATTDGSVYAQKTIRDGWGGSYSATLVFFL